MEHLCKGCIEMLKEHCGIIKIKLVEGASKNLLITEVVK